MKPKTKSPQKTWCFLTYIAGDNNLSDAGLEDIREMCDEGAGPDLWVGVEIDTYGEFSGSVRYEITESDWSGKAYRKVIERIPEQDSGDPKTLKNFLKWGLERHNAENYIVVVWNHGAGFRTPKRDIGYDDFGTSLSMPEIEWALSQAGIGKKNKLSILGFDACLMNMLEIVHHLKDQVEILVGSQQTEPGDGWPYDKVLNVIKSSANVIDLARGIVEVYISDYRHAGTQNITQSAIDTSKTEKAVQSLHKLGGLLVRKLPSIKGDMQSLRYAIQDFEMADYVDGVHLCKLLQEKIADPKIQQAARQLEEDLFSSIIHNGKNGYMVRNAYGLSIWFPGYHSLYLSSRAKYTALNFARKYPGWIDFLDAYFA